jgi:glucose/arabinose dehydrogenase
VPKVTRLRIRPWICAVPIVLLGVPATGSGGVEAMPVVRSSFVLRQVASGLPGAVFVAAAPSGLPGRLYVVQKGGRIVVVDSGRPLPRPFLDMRGQVAGGELRGLFSVAFHPDFRRNGELFVNYVGRDGDLYVARFRAIHGVAALSSRRVLLHVPTATTDPDGHYGGQLAFGPDGRLYVGFGDANRPAAAQDPATLLGKLVRLDVDTPGAAPEIVAYGLRNPWRMAFDRRTGDLYVGDVGETHREEVDRLPKGFRGLANFGWPGWEGSVSTAPAPPSLPGRVLPPLLEYAHSETRCYAVVGGYVYRGADLPSLDGRYLYGDLCGGVWSVRIAGGVARARREERLVPPGLLVSFGEGSNGELYMVTLEGRVYEVASG